MNQQWTAFNQISKMLDTNQSIELNVHKIIEIIVDSIPQADAGFFLLWKDDLQCLTIDAAVNFQQQHYMNTRLKQNEGISGKVYTSGQGVMLNSAAEIDYLMGNMRKPNKKYYLDSFVHYGEPKNCISVPIEYNEERFGVFTVDNFLNDGDFSMDDFNFLQAIAFQVAIAIRLSCDIQKSQQRTRDLENSITIHQKLNQHILEGHSIEQLILYLDTLTNDPYFLLNAVGNLEFSSRNFDRALNFISSLIDANFHENWKNQQYISIYDGQNCYLHIFRVSSSVYISGFLVIKTNKPHLPLMTQLTITHAASIIAMAQMKQRNSFERELQKRQSLLALLTDYNQSIELRTLCTYYFETDRFLSIMTIEHHFLISSDFTSLLNFEKRLNDTLSHTKIILIPTKNRIYCIIGSTTKQNSTVQNVINNFLPECRFFTGRSVKSFDNLYLSYMDIEFILFINKIDNKISYTSFKDLGVFRYLLQLSDDEKIIFVEDELALLMKEKNSRELLDTLLTYFEHKKNAALTAQYLHLHINSIYYRLTQIETLLQIDLADFQNNINLYSALFLEKYVYHKKKQLHVIQ
ncbi:helix-turn-helix domain-containing protein [Kurthia sibirica]|uniref:GAF domain-containing protein n=1 Tax=Kurthia sibirica TaxID=202750 RepID=A0A2U3AQ08_9BACL|nr:helix-turn-helix domain-containing protein [Kurthia sibirica]PWI26640.1 hypothetical protein DEX24_02435 [Kurthia sibirica]GEK32899.1 hypothetical protein KSI01_04320 [Kurthia sibirica]